MAEFCLECWNKLHKTDYTVFDVTMDDGYSLCEGCGRIKRDVLKPYRDSYPHWMWHMYIVEFLFWVLALPFKLIIFIFRKLKG